MSRPAPVPHTVARLVAHLTDGSGPGTLAGELSDWLIESRRFRAFADAHRDKIRKKLRTAADDEALRDVRTELRVSALLLADRRIDLAFEARGSTRGGPDFVVDFRGHRAFTLEVTRLRRDPGGAAAGRPILAKLRQLPPGVANVLLLAIGGERADALDVTGAVRAIRARADAKDEAFFERRGLDGSRGFYDRFLRLGAVITWCERGAGARRAETWVNGSSRIAVPAAALRACVDALRGVSPSGS